MNLALSGLATDDDVDNEELIAMDKTRQKGLQKDMFGKCVACRF